MVLTILSNLKQCLKIGSASKGSRAVFYGWAGKGKRREKAGGETGGTELIFKEY